MIKLLPTIVAIVAIAVLEGVALSEGINGTGLAGAIGIIGGLGGYSISQARKPKPPPTKVGGKQD